MNNATRITADLIAYFRRTRFNPISGLTPEVLTRHLDGFAAGYLRDFALMGTTIAERDDRISVVWPKRCKAVSRRKFAVQINEGLPEEMRARAEEHRAALQYCYDNLTATSAMDRNQKGGFRLLARQMMEAAGLRYAVHELVWQPRVVQGKPRLTFTATYVPLWFFENTTGRLRFMRSITSLTGEDMADDDWLVTVGDGIFIALAIAYMFKQMSLKDWVSFNEKFGMPGLLGKTSAAKDTPQWKAMEDAVAAFANDWAAVCSKDETIELIEAKGSGQLPFEPLVDRMDRAISAICRGGDLSTMSKDGGAVGSNAQEGEGDILEEDDLLMIQESLQQISRIVCRELFAEDPLAYVSVVVPKVRNTEETTKKIDTLTKHKVPVGVEWARAELGVPAPAEDEQTLEFPAAPAPFDPTQAAGLALPNAASLVAASAENDAMFKEASARMVAPATRAVLDPLLRRLAQIADMQEPAEQRGALERFRAALPELARQAIARAPEAAPVFAQILGPSFLSGFIEAAQAKAKPIAKAA